MSLPAEHACSVLCSTVNYRHCGARYSLELFHLARLRLQQQLPISPSTAPHTPVLLSASMSLMTLGTSYAWNRAVFVFLCLAFFHLANLSSWFIHVVAYDRIAFC